MPPDEEKKEDQLNPESEDELKETPQVASEGDLAPEDVRLPPPGAHVPFTSSNEHTWAMLAHFSILLNLITGVLGPVFALIVYLVYKDESRYVAYQSLQSIIFQLIAWVGVGFVIGGMWLINFLLLFVGIGFLCLPFTFLATILLLAVPLASLVYGVYAGVQCSGGADFRYWLVGDWVRSTYEGS